MNPAVYPKRNSAIISVDRAVLEQALAYILATEHDQLCDVLDLDDEGRHKPCSCLLQDVLDALRAALAEPMQEEQYAHRAWYTIDEVNKKWGGA